MYLQAIIQYLLRDKLNFELFYNEKDFIIKKYNYPEVSIFFKQEWMLSQSLVKNINEIIYPSSYIEIKPFNNLINFNWLIDNNFFGIRDDHNKIIDELIDSFQESSKEINEQYNNVQIMLSDGLDSHLIYEVFKSI